jgi:hydrogenase maturation factor
MIDAADGTACRVGDEHCITCGDEANEMRVVKIDAERSLALCAGEDGARSSVETALVLPIGIGDTLLVHAGTAIARVAPTNATVLGRVRA